MNQHFMLTRNTKLISITKILTASLLYELTEAYVLCCKLHYLYYRTFTPTETQQPTLTSQPIYQTIQLRACKTLSFN